MTKEELLKYLLNSGALKSPEIIRAFKVVDRADFVKPEDKTRAYEDYPFSLGLGQTISQPTTVALMLELLSLKKGDKILDVGSGSGWTTQLLTKIVGPKGEVYGLEIVPQLVEFGRANLKKYGDRNAQISRAKKRLGLPPKAPFDRILVSASANTLPKELLNQLKPGGVMVIPVKTSIFRLTKNLRGEIISQEFPGFVFVPLIESS